MKIIISNSSDKPIYEQISSQIKQSVIKGELKSGEILPSIRVLAKELRISVITTKRAYEDLEKSGFIHTVVGKGSFVAEKNTDAVKEEHIKIMEKHLKLASEAAKSGGVSEEEMIYYIRMLFEENEQ